MPFLVGLADDNTKRYFETHRTLYEEQVLQPLMSLVVAIGDELRERVSPAIRSEPKIGKSMFRINRDLRFSKDKTPYHTYLDSVYWEGDSPRASPGFILRITPDEVIIGAGVVGLFGERLERWRTAVLDDDRGIELATLIEATRCRLRGATLTEPTRKRVPKGFPADHPRADLLRRDGLHLSTALAMPDSVTSASFATWCLERHVQLADLHRWLVRELGG